MKKTFNLNNIQLDFDEVKESIVRIIFAHAIGSWIIINSVLSLIQMEPLVDSVLLNRAALMLVCWVGLGSYMAFRWAIEPVTKTKDKRSILIVAGIVLAALWIFNEAILAVGVALG